MNNPSPPQDFDPGESFSIFLSYFKRSNNSRLPKLKAFFKKVVSTEVKWVLLHEFLEYSKEDGTLPNNPEVVLLGARIKEKEAETELEIPTEPIEPVAPGTLIHVRGSEDEIRAELDGKLLYAPSVSDQDVKEACLLILRDWPQNPEHQERPTKAYDAMKIACKEFSLADIVETCQYYSRNFLDPSSGMTYPYRLSNFVSRDELFLEWRQRSRYVPKAVDLDVFNATFSWYPRFLNRDISRIVKDSMTYWFRHIQPEDRWAFLSAAKKLRFSKKELMVQEQKMPEEIEKYTPSMISFIGTWREQKYFRIMGGDIASGCLPILQAGNFLSTDALYDVGVGLEDYLAARLVKYNSDAVETLVALCRYIQQELETNGHTRPEFASKESFDLFVRRLYDAGWEQALKPPRIVLARP